ncbi:MAG: DUF433 domain-containing protein [Rubrobacteraceae bacterium]|nr:DUF433 domain-containing protein [Rubrobacteraceae bacterium]
MRRAPAERSQPRRGITVPLHAFKGTRVPVEILIQHLAAGDLLDEFLEGFPGPFREQAVAYLEDAAGFGRCDHRGVG